MLRGPFRSGRPIFLVEKVTEMAKVTAPLLSFGGSGQMAKTQVYSSWRGIPYVRKYVVPSNPKTTNQQETRSVFAWGSGTWKQAPSLLTQVWTAFAKGKQFTNRNAFIGQNTKALRGLSVLTTMIFSPGAGGGVQPLSITGTGGSGSATIATTNPAPPTGWTISAMVALATLQGNPSTLAASTIYAGNDAVTFNSVDITGLAAGTYVIGAYLIYNKGAGVLAYSPSINSTVVVT